MTEEAVAAPQGGDAAPRARGTVVGVAIASYVGLSLGIITGPVSARVLGPHGEGELATAGVWQSLILAVGSVGLARAVGHAVGRERRDPGQVLGALLPYVVIAVPVTTAAGWAAVAGPLAHLSRTGRLGALITIAIAPW